MARWCANSVSASARVHSKKAGASASSQRFSRVNACALVTNSVTRSSATGAPSTATRSRNDSTCGETKRPVTRPMAVRPAAVMVVTLPLPLVPTTLTVRGGAVRASSSSRRAARCGERTAPARVRVTSQSSAAWYSPESRSFMRLGSCFSCACGAAGGGVGPCADPTCRPCRAVLWAHRRGRWTLPWPLSPAARRGGRPAGAA